MDHIAVCIFYFLHTMILAGSSGILGNAKSQRGGKAGEVASRQALCLRSVSVTFPLTHTVFTPFLKHVEMHYM